MFMCYYVVSNDKQLTGFDIVQENDSDIVDSGRIHFGRVWNM